MSFEKLREMSEDGLKLARPSRKWEDEYRSVLAECGPEEDGHSGHILARVNDDFAKYVRSLHNQEKGFDIPPGFVPQTTFWFVHNGVHIVGEVRLRHRLTPGLELEGGHIGYWIRPSERRKGYGTRILALTLERAREMGLSRVLVTCSPDNIGSARIIEKNGGIKVTDGVSAETGEVTSRYWIDL